MIGAILTCRPLDPKALRGPNIGDPPSVGRAELQITVTIDCLDADLVLFALPVHGQFYRDPGFAPAPQRAIKIRQIADIRPVDRDDPVAVLDPRPGTRAFRRDAAHHEFTVYLLEIGAEPRPHRGRAPERDQVAHYRPEPIDRHEHIARKPAIGIPHDQRPDPDELAVGRDQRGAAPCGTGWRGEDRVFQQVLPITGEGPT